MFTIRQCAAWASTLTTQKIFPERRKPRKAKKKGNPSTESTSFLFLFSAEQGADCVPLTSCLLGQKTRTHNGQLAKRANTRVTATPQDFLTTQSPEESEVAAVMPVNGLASSSLSSFSEIAALARLYLSILSVVTTTCGTNQRRSGSSCCH